jgi:hypothetical protein
MTRLKPPPLFISLALVVLLSASLACTLLAPQPASTTSVEELLATMTQQIWTPTSPATQTPPPPPPEAFTPTPTETPLPTLTPTPSYDWCKGMDTRTAKETDVHMGPLSGDKGYAAFGCLAQINGPLEFDFPETALLVTLGFNDKDGVLHLYPAVIGGLIYTHAPGDFQYPSCYSTAKPALLGLNEYVDSLAPYLGSGAPAKPFPMYIYTVLGYENHSPPEASFVNRYEELNQRLRAAIETGGNFPDVPERFRIYILPGLEPCS